MRYTDHNTVEDLKIAYIGGGSQGWAWGMMSDLADAGVIGEGGVGDGLSQGEEHLHAVQLRNLAAHYVALCDVGITQIVSLLSSMNPHNLVN